MPKNKAYLKVVVCWIEKCSSSGQKNNGCVWHFADEILGDQFFSSWPSLFHTLTCALLCYCAPLLLRHVFICVSSFWCDRVTRWVTLHLPPCLHFYTERFWLHQHRVCTHSRNSCLNCLQLPLSTCVWWLEYIFRFEELCSS